MKKMMTAIIGVIASLFVFMPMTSEVHAEDLADDCMYVGVVGRYCTNAEAAVERINQIRYEACENGYPNPSNPEVPLTLEDYVPIKWSFDLEEIARIRAGEASIAVSHTRPNGKSCFTVLSSNGVQSYAENLAWGPGSDMLTAISMWYREKDSWAKNKNTSGTGHYTIMINPKYTYVGLGVFCSSDTEFYATSCAEFSMSRKELDTDKDEAIDRIVARIQVKNQYLTSSSISLGKSGQLKVGDVTKCRLVGRTDINGRTSDIRVLGKRKKTSSNTSIASFSSDGMLKINGFGSCTIKVVDINGVTHTKTINVGVPKVKISNITAKKKTIIVHWKKPKGSIYGYQLQVSTDKKFKKIARTMNFKAKGRDKKIMAHLKRHTRYYVRLRVKVRVNGRLKYGAWSKTTSVRTK